MQIVYRSNGRDLELDLDLGNPDATLGDVVRAVEGLSVDAVTVDGRSFPASSLVADAGLPNGAHVTRQPVPAPRGRAPALRRLGLPELAVVAGPGSGQRFPLGAGRHRIGRGPGVQLDHHTVSREHLVLDLDPSGTARVTDLGSLNGTVVDGHRLPSGTPVELEHGAIVEVGAVALVLRPPVDDRPVGAGVVGPGGAVPFNRPPRTAAAPAAEALDVPAEPREEHRPDFSWTAVAGPLVLAAVMIGVTGDVRFALFALLSPVLAVGLFAEGRRRAARKTRAAQERHDDAVEELRDAIAHAQAVDTARLWARCPDPAEVLRRAALPSVHLWERRRDHDDVLALHVGLGDVAWRPTLRNPTAALPAPVDDDPEVHVLRRVPVAAELADGGVVGIVGHRGGAVALARSLVCQAAVHHGPADVTIGVFVDEGRGPEWDWSKWLPHTLEVDGAPGARWLGEGRDRCDALLRRLGAGAGAATVLVVVDSDTFTEGRDSPARTLLTPDRRRRPGEPAPRASGIVVASTRDRLPASCTVVVEVVDDEAGATVHLPLERREIPDVLTGGLTERGARVCARDLARLEDPELHVAGGDLPELVRLLPLLGLDAVDGPSVRRSWRRGARTRPRVPLGVTAQGVFTLDLVEDGPHGLVGGTTGSGKSELLRTLVAGLAAGTDPRHLTFVLVDYKGGAAFDQCARLPHTVGMVTDLDDQLAERALTALNAELHHRERRLRRVGADTIDDYLRRDPTEPLPRLLVVIDEFATLAKDLPDFLAALVGIAQRGRTLGVHLLLATQRPAGVVNDNIRANTNLRIALRMQDPGDSIDVIDVRDAAGINRARRGRALARLGPGELVALQTALVTCVSDDDAAVSVAVSPFTFAAPPQPAAPAPGGPEPGRTDLVRLVDAIVEANALEGIPAPRRPWPEPLPTSIPLDALLRAGGVALADDPRRQTQYPVGWDATAGNIALLGVPGSGTTTALAALALGLAAAHAPERLELQVFDFGVGDLAALAALPHTGTVVAADDRERQVRLVRHLVAELARRRADPGAARRRLVVLIDNLAGMRAALADTEGGELLDQLGRVVADGQGVGISFAVGADRAHAVPTAFAVTDRWLFRLADAFDYGQAGIDRGNLPARVPGRAVVAETGLHIQVGLPGPALPEAVAAVAARYGGAGRVAPEVGVLPARVTVHELRAAARVDEEPWVVPVGIAEADLGCAALTLYEGEHALIAGPARSGRSTALRTIAATLRAGPAVHLAGIGGRRSPLRDCPAFDEVAGTPGEAAALLARLRTVGGPVALLVDDAETLDDADGAIDLLLKAEIPGLHAFVAGSNDTLRSLYGHWTKTVRRSRTGLLLRPNVDLDGDLLGTTLPRRAPVALSVPGRGYLVAGGETRVVQLAAP